MSGTPEGFFERVNLEIHPFGDVFVNMCTECGAIVNNENAHYLYHRQLDADAD